MKIDDRKKMDYQEMVQDIIPKSNPLVNCMRAFWTGGVICTIGQIITNVVISAGVDKDHVGFYVSSILILSSIVLTSFGVYDKIGKYAGGGTLMPITGFANTIASAAIEYRKEGFVLGMGAKIFTVGGPVILYGLITSVIVGAIHYIIK